MWGILLRFLVPITVTKPVTSDKSKIAADPRDTKLVRLSLMQIGVRLCFVHSVVEPFHENYPVRIPVFLDLYDSSLR